MGGRLTWKYDQGEYEEGDMAHSAPYRWAGEQEAVPQVEELPPLSPLQLDDPSPASFPLYQAPSPLPSSLRNPENRYTKGKNIPSESKIHKALKARLTSEITDNLPELDEGELRAFYTALIGSGRPESSAGLLRVGAPEERGRLAPAERREVLQRLFRRILPAPAEAGDAESSAAAVQRLQETNQRTDEVLEILKAVALDVASQSAGAADVPLGLVSRQEWDALYDDAISSKDPRRAEGVVALRQAHGQQSDDTYLPDLITSYAGCGMLDDVYRLEAVLQQTGQYLSPNHHDIIISHLLRLPSPAQAAIAHLKSYETTLPAPQSSYNLVLSHLLTQSATSHTRALAWDLFAHMRLKAHPTPSREVYTTMIAGCATTADPKPEHARDLWTELTVDGGIIPEEPEYTAIIRALSSTKRDYLEAFDLFRQMLARHHEATYSPFGEAPEKIDTRWIPSLATWKALLEGTKRAGDLGRARWVLAECVKLMSASRAMGMDVPGPDEDLMGSVFMSYAAWKPVVRRAQIREQAAASPASRTETADTAEESRLERDSIGGEGEKRGLPSPLATSESSVPPTTSADALREANALFAQLQSATKDRANSMSPRGNVKMTPRLLNSFLSVHFVHSPSLEAARNTWKATWAECGTSPNGWTYMLALVRCAQSNRASGGSMDRMVASQWGKELWESYLTFSQSTPPPTRDEAYRIGLGARQVERAWRAVIRLHALSEELPTALQRLDEFHLRYPSRDIIDGYAPAPDSGLDMRFSDPTTILEPDVPPHLLFADVDILHQRLVRDEQWSQVGHVKWVVMGYEKALEKRRKWRLRGVGKAREARKAKAALLAMEQEHQQLLDQPAASFA